MKSKDVSWFSLDSWPFLSMVCRNHSKKSAVTMRLKEVRVGVCVCVCVREREREKERADDIIQEKEENLEGEETRE
jgi:hypothetical protein